jgi:hypothetical protein
MRTAESWYAAAFLNHPLPRRVSGLLDRHEISVLDTTQQQINWGF